MRKKFLIIGGVIAILIVMLCVLTGCGTEESTTGNSNEKNNKISNDTSYVGCYADLDGDGQADGIIYADLAVGKEGQYKNENGIYTVPTETNLKEYYIESENVAGGIKTITANLIAPVEGTTGNDRFYIMSLEDFDSSTYYWYQNAIRYSTEGYEIATSTSFGTGKSNTANMIEYWNNEKYGKTNDSDMWGKVQEEVKDGWFVPSAEEWATFGDALNVTKSNYANLGLKE